MKRLLQLSLVLFLFTGCSSPTTFNATYFSPAFEQVRTQHKVLAILPFDVHNHYKRMPRGETVKSLREMDMHDAYTMQRDLYRYCLRILSKDKYTVDFQHVNETNAILIKKGIDHREVKNLKKGDLARILGVDAVIHGEVHQIRRKWNLSFFGRLFNSSRQRRNKVDARISIHIEKRKKPVWKYSDGASIAGEDGVLGLSRKLLRTVAQHIPYQKEPVKMTRR